MDIESLKVRALKHYEDKNWSVLAAESFAAIFSCTGLSWPYFLLAKVYEKQDKKEMARSMYHLYLLRRRDDDPEDWSKESKDFLNESIS